MDRSYRDAWNSVGSRNRTSLRNANSRSVEAWTHGRRQPRACLQQGDRVQIPTASDTIQESIAAIPHATLAVRKLIGPTDKQAMPWVAFGIAVKSLYMEAVRDRISVVALDAKAGRSISLYITEALCPRVVSLEG